MRLQEEGDVGKWVILVKVSQMDAMYMSQEVIGLEGGIGMLIEEEKHEKT